MGRGAVTGKRFAGDVTGFFQHVKAGFGLSERARGSEPRGETPRAALDQVEHTVEIARVIGVGDVIGTRLGREIGEQGDRRGAVRWPRDSSRARPRTL